MKKFILSAAVFAGLITGFSSCTKCYTCDFGPTRGKEKLCTKDFPDKNAGLKLSIDAYRERGYECIEE